MKLRFTIFLVVILPIIAYAATRNISSDGNWTDSGIWTGGNIGGAADDVTTSATVDVTIESGDNITILIFTPGNSNSMTIDAGGQLTAVGLTVNNGFTLNVDGDLIINGDLSVNNNLILNVSGSVTINGNVIMNNGAGLDVTSTGTIEITGDFTGGNNTDVNVDGSLGVAGDVSVGNGSNLTGTGTFSAGGSCDDGTSGFCESSTLPIVLLSFEAFVHDEHIELQWSTSEQENFDYFCIERSSDGLDYDCIGQVNGQGWSNEVISYSFNDSSPLIGGSYYRLKAVDLDGKYENHRIIFVEYDSDSFGFQVFPNPTTGSDVNLQLGFVPNEFLSVEVIDLMGRSILVDKTNKVNSKIELKSSVQSGLYLIRLSSKTGLHQTRRLEIR